MFILWQAYRTEWIRPPVLYVDTLDTWNSFTSVKILATEAEETLSCVEGALEFVTDNATYSFPLTGRDFLTAQTGTLRIFLPSASCGAGITAFSLLNTGATRLPLTSDRICGSGLRGVANAWTRTLSTRLQAQSFTIPAPLRVQTTTTLITSGGR